MMIKTNLYHVDVSNVIKVYKHIETYDRLIKKADKNGNTIWYITGSARLFKVENTIVHSGYWKEEDYKIEETPATRKHKMKYPEDYLWQKIKW